jgi:hypothetical protein
MTRIGPAPSPLAPPHGGPIAAIVAEADAAIARLAVGTILAAQVVGRDAAGLLVLRTEQGALSIRTALSPPPGSTVLVEVQNVGTQSSVVILAVRKPSTDAPIVQNAPFSDPTPANVPVQRDAPEIAAPSLRPGSVVVARLMPDTASISPPPANHSASGSAAPDEPSPGAHRTIPPNSAIAGGIRLTLRTVVVAEALASGRPEQTQAEQIVAGPTGSSRPIAPPANMPPGPTTPTPAPATSAAINAGVPANSSALLGASPLRGETPSRAAAPGTPSAPTMASSDDPGQAASRSGSTPSAAPARPPVAPAMIGPTPARVTQPTPARPVAGAMPPLVAHSRFEGVVEGWMPPDRLVLRTTYGTLVTQASNGPLPGTTVAFEVLEAVRPAPAELAPRPGAAAWPTFERALRHLAETEPAIARELIREVLPNAGGNAVAAVLAFLRAARTRDPGAWIGGAAVAALTSSGRGDLVGQLLAEFGDNTRAAVDAPPDWRGVTVPFHDGGRLHDVRLAFRRQRPNGDRSAASRRFVVTLTTSRLGPLQFDGLVVERRFELIVRSGAALTPRHRDGMRAIFDDSCGVAGLSGHIAFASGVPFVDPLAAKTVRHTVDPVVA